MRFLPLLALLIAAPLAAQTHRAENVRVGSSGMMGGVAGPYTLFSLAHNRVVPNADSASTAWDLAFRGTTVLVNGGTSGPGVGAARLVEAPFESVLLYTGDPLLADGENECPRGAGLAVCTGSGNGWYVYGERGVSPLPDRTLVVRLADGSSLAKVRFLGYTLGDEQPDGSRPRFYAFEYAPLP